MTVWEILHKARVVKFKNGHAYGSAEDNVTAMEMFRDALEQDPNSSDAISGIATCHWHNAINSWSDDPAKSGEAALRRAKEAVEYSYQSMEADPNYSRGRQRLIAALVAAGELTEAKREFAILKKAMPAFDLDYVKRTYPFVNNQHLNAYSKYFTEVGAQ